MILQVSLMTGGLLQLLWSRVNSTHATASSTKASSTVCCSSESYLCGYNAGAAGA